MLLIYVQYQLYSEDGEMTPNPAHLEWDAGVNEIETQTPETKQGVGEAVTSAEATKKGKF